MTGGRTSQTEPQSKRRDRRAAARAERAAQRDAARRKTTQPVWRSPIVVFTAAAIVVGVLVIGFALLSRPSTPSTNDLQAPVADVPAGLADGRSMGSPQAPVTVEIWSDFQCPYCAQVATRVEPPLVQQYIATGVARLVYHDAAFQGQSQGSYDESVEAAAAARCAADQGKFWEMHNWLFTNSGERVGAFNRDRLDQMAAAAGLDVAAWSQCMDTGEKQAAVRQETQQAISNGINQTPTLFINGERYTGQLTLTEIGAAIDDAAGGATPAPMGNIPAAGG